MADFNRRSFREQIVITLKKIYSNGHTTLSGGNISVKDAGDNIYISPAGKDKGTLKTEDIVKVDSGNNVEGQYEPSSELPFHKAIYRVRDDINSIIHAHSPALVAFSIIHQMPAKNFSPEMEKVCGSIGYAAYGLPGSHELGEKNAEIFSQGHNAIIMENHGIVIGGKDMNDAYQRFEALEYYAQTLIHGKTIGQFNHLKEDELAKYQELISSFPQESDYIEDYTSSELDKRRELVSYIDRAYSQKMSHSSLGSFFSKINDESFLVTPYQMPRWDINSADIVKITKGLRETGKYPDPFYRIPQSIFKKTQNIHTIIISQPTHLMAFALTDQKVNVRTIPESWLILKDIPRISFRQFIEDDNTIIEKLNEGYTSILIDNIGIMVMGATMAETYDKLEVAEFTAKSLIYAHSLGELKPISDRQIEDLKDFFF